MDVFTAMDIVDGHVAVTAELQIEAWQYLIDTEMCWTLPGRYGRIASSLIEQEICNVCS
jgi:hypothetical protein